MQSKIINHKSQAANKECTVLVSSCDKYADVAKVCIHFLRRFWADCPFEIILLTETTPVSGYDRTIFTGLGKSWSEMLVAALDQITTPYVMMLMDDYYLESPVDTARVLMRLEEAQRYNAANLRLIPSPKPTAFRAEAFGKREEHLFAFRKNVAYCVSCQVGFWKRDYMRTIASQTKSAWEFERQGSYLVRDEKRPILCTAEKEFPFLDTVHKGYWEPWGVNLLKKYHLEEALKKRGLPPFTIRLKEAIKRVIFHLSPELVVRIQNRLQAG